MSDESDLPPLQDALFRAFYEAEISGEAAFGRLAEHVSTQHQRRALQLLEELEAVTGHLLSSLISQRGIRSDVEAARRRGEGWASGYISNPDWHEFWKDFVPMTEPWLDGMKFLRAVCDDADRTVVDQMIGHEEALLQFARREAAGSADALKPVEDYLARGTTAGR